MKIFILAGQSNMAGRGEASFLPARLQQPQTDVRYYYQCVFAADKSTPFNSDGWGYLQPCRKHISTPGNHFGPEITFGRFMADMWNNQIGLIKVAWGGTNLAEEWNPEATTGKQLYKELMERIRSAEELLEKQGQEAEYMGLLWMQGESDAMTLEFAQAFRHNQELLIARIREDLGTADLPFIMGQIVNRTNPKMVYAEMVRQAQAEVAAGDANTALVLTDDLSDRGDGAHFTAEALMTLGERFARAYLELSG